MLMTNTRPTTLFPDGYRASGVVLDIAALPSRYGIGDVGPSALSWVDRLRDAGQGWWQTIQLDSPRCADYGSSFGANTLLLSPDWLIEDGLLTHRDCECVNFAEGSIDYDAVVPFKHWLLEKAWTRFNQGERKDLRHSYEQFRKKQGHWLEDYALFRALKLKYRKAHHLEWPSNLVRRDQSAIADVRQELAKEIDQVRFSAFLLFRQTRRLKQYANQNGVRLIGDLPFFISADSSESWACPELFVSDTHYTPFTTTDLVPICFSSNERMSSEHDTGSLSRVSYRWCVDRLRALLEHVDVARVDVRALAAPWHAADDARPVRRGASGADKHLTGLIADAVPSCRTEVSASRDLFHVPSTRVLQFAFDGIPDNPHLPQNYNPDSVVYIGRNGTKTREWFEKLPDAQRALLCDYLKHPIGKSTEVAWELIRLAWSSSAALAMVSLQDLLNVEDQLKQSDGDGDHHRWRCSEETLSAAAFYLLRDLTKRSNRSAQAKAKTLTHPAREPRTGVEIGSVPCAT